MATPDFRQCNLDSCHLASSSCAYIDKLDETKFVATVFDWQNWVLILLSFLVLMMGPKLFALSYKFSGGQRTFDLNIELVEEDNKAVAVALTGWVLALGILCSTSVRSFGDDAVGEWGGFAYQFKEGGPRTTRGKNIGRGAYSIVIGVFLLVAAQYINRFVIARKVNISAGILAHNIACGIVEGAYFICTALCLGGVGASRGSNNMGEEIGILFTLFAISQAMFFIYAELFQCCFSSFDVWAEIERIEQVPDGVQKGNPRRRASDATPNNAGRGNMAAALSYSIHLVSLANLLYGVTSKTVELPTICVWFLLGGTVLMLIRFLADKCILPGEQLDKEIREDRNWGAAMVAGCAQLGTSVVLNTFVADPCTNGLSLGSIGDLLQDDKYMKTIFNWDRLVALFVIAIMLLLAKLAFTIPFVARRSTARKIMSLASDSNLSDSASYGQSAAASPPINSGTLTDMLDYEAQQQQQAAGAGAGAGVQGAVNPPAIAQGFSERPKVQREDSHSALATAALSGVSAHYGDEFKSFNLNYELVTADNKAVAVAFSGYILGVMVMLAGNLSSFSTEFNPASGSFSSSTMSSDAALTSSYTLAIWALVGLVLMVVSHFVHDFCIMYKFLSCVNIAQGNVATAVAESGAYIAAGLVVGASVAGDSDQEVWEDALATFIVFVFMQVFMIGFSRIYERTRGYDHHHELESNNVAAGIAYASNVIAVAQLMYQVVMSTASLFALTVWTVFGVIVLVIGRICLVRIVMPGQTLAKEIGEDHNWGAALVSGALKISLAAILNTSVRSCPYQTCLRV